MGDACSLAAASDASAGAMIEETKENGFIKEASDSLTIDAPPSAALTGVAALFTSHRSTGKTREGLQERFRGPFWWERLAGSRQRSADANLLAWSPTCNLSLGSVTNLTLAPSLAS